MLLLTSSQVSVAISSSIVFFFTTALFLTGYVLQQQTVRDLRVAIRPTPRTPHSKLTYLPAAFDDAAKTEKPAVVPAQDEGQVESLMQIVLEDHPNSSPDSRPRPSTNSQPAEKPLSRAERRKRIKADVLAAGEGESYRGYRRRAW